MVTLLLEQSINGLFLGCLLFLVSTGLGLVLGIGRFVNLAHGSFYMLGAYGTAWLTARGLSFWPSLLVSALMTGFAAMLVERGMLRRLLGGDPLLQVLATLGIVIASNELVLMVWGRQALPIAIPPSLSGTVAVGPVAVPVFRLAVIGLGLALALLMAALVAGTSLGRQIRATAALPATARALGVDTSRVIALVFGTGAALAAFAGGLNGAMTTVRAGMGEPILLVALAVVIVGGSHSIGAILAAALAIGLLDTLGRAFLPELLRAVLPGYAISTLVPAVIASLLWIIVIAALLLRAEDPLAAE
jgi:branched-chain amino acid transport system permease protein